MKTIIAQIDSAGTLFDRNGNSTGLVAGGCQFEEYVGKEESIPTKKLLQLKDAGFDTEDIISMKKEGLI